MSSGQSLRNGSSVEPGLPNTRLMPKARSRPKVASLTVSAAVVLAGLRDDMRWLPSGFSCIPPWHLSEGGSNPPLDGLLCEVKLARERPRALHTARALVQRPRIIFNVAVVLGVRDRCAPCCRRRCLPFRQVTDQPARFRRQQAIWHTLLPD